jgi:hypothetical protein
VSALVFRRRHADRALVLFLSRNTRRLRLSPTALARSFSLIRVPPQLSVPTPLDRRRAVRISLSRTARRCDSVHHTKICSAWRAAPPVFEWFSPLVFGLVLSGPVPFFSL